jgi:NAD(P)-dependent dehydrogenase (short-subunit alcohol dehydrogenase family)
VALKLAKAGWQVALIGRRDSALQDTLAQAGEAANRMRAFACDVSDEQAVAGMAREVLQSWGSVEALVNSAGTNTPARSLEVLSLENYHRIVDINLNGAYYCVQAFLPGMRAQQAGTIVNVVSVAGIRASAKSGVAYVVSKFGMAGLTQSINAEEREHGIRACSVFPGDINTPILDLRPNPPPPEARLNMLQAEDVAECVLLAINLPPRAVIEELVLQPR